MKIMVYENKISSKALNFVIINDPWNVRRRHLKIIRIKPNHDLNVFAIWIINHQRFNFDAKKESCN